jgi:hypothetical protein
MLRQRAFGDTMVSFQKDGAILPDPKGFENF